MGITPEFNAIQTPAELALPLAEKLVMDKYLDGFTPASTYEQNELAILEAKADLAGMLGLKYFVSSHRSLSIPTNIDDDGPVQTFDFNEGLDFSGQLISFSTVRIGRNLGNNAVRALCLTFDNVTLLPYFDRLPSDRLLHTPAFAVQSIDALPRTETA